MKQTLYEELGGTYTQQGDYLLPNIMLPEQPKYEIDVWGQRHRRFLKEHHRVHYYNMLTKCTLYPHLAEVEQQAQDMFLWLAEEMAKREEITEQLKATNQMEWVRRMNNIQNSATEIVNTELIYKIMAKFCVKRICNDVFVDFGTQIVTYKIIFNSSNRR